MDDLEKTIDGITQRIEKTENLSVFSPSVNRIRQISSSDEVTAISHLKRDEHDIFQRC